MDKCIFIFLVKREKKTYWIFYLSTLLYPTSGGFWRTKASKNPKVTLEGGVEVKIEKIIY